MSGDEKDRGRKESGRKGWGRNVGDEKRWTQIGATHRALRLFFEFLGAPALAEESFAPATFEKKFLPPPIKSKLQIEAEVIMREKQAGIERRISCN